MSVAQVISPHGKIRVYVAGPYSGDTVGGVRNAVAAADQLVCLGFVPFVPHLSMLWDLVSATRITYDLWIEQDLHWLRLCHAVLRLHGDSYGADREVREALAMGIPVFEAVHELTRWRDGKTA